MCALLGRVTKGETIQITKRGVPVAKLMPPASLLPSNPLHSCLGCYELRFEL